LTPTRLAAKPVGMPLHAARTAAASIALALVAACGGSSSTPPPPGPLELSCSVSLSGPNPVLTVLGRARSTAATGAPITVTLALAPAPQAFTLSAPSWTGSAELRGAAVTAGATVSGQATVDGVPARASCVAYGGLPVLTAHADRTATGADIGWDAVAGAVIYRWSLRQGPSGPVVTSGSTTGTSAQATIALDPLQGYLVEVGAYAITGAEASYPTPLPTPKASFARTVFTSGNTGGDGTTAWQLFGPGDFVGGTLTVQYPALAAGERLAVLLVNAGGDDAASASVTASGTGNPTLSLAAPAPLLAMAGGTGTTASGPVIDRSGVMAGEALVSARREETIARLRDGRLPRVAPGRPADDRLLATAAAAAMPATRSFCQGQYSGTTFVQVWKSATLAYETAHAAFYYTDEVKPGIDKALLPANRPDFFTSIGAAYETRILTALNTYFGPESDVDQNGKVIFLFGNLGKSGSSFPVGYFWPGDIELPLATPSTCPRNTVGNRADMLYLIDPGNFTTNWDPTGANYKLILDMIVDGEYPSTMAHELQHDVNYNTRCPPGAACGVDEELWLNEGLSMLSETVAGYGLHTATSRANVRTYQGETYSTTGLPYYQSFSMTGWEGSPYGNYAGAQAYMQYLLDHATPAMTKALENKWLAGKANVEAATGEAWEVGFARFTTAAMFSNEDASAYAGGVVTSHGNLLADPLFNYLGDLVAPDYVPWHHYTGSCAGTPKDRDAYVAFTPLFPGASTSLRKDGWAAFATGPGTGGAATIAVQSSATLRPHVVVVKYSGKLPSYAPPTCP
jgi:hypothetical protein